MQSTYLTDNDALALSSKGHRLLVVRANGDRFVISTPVTFRASGKTITFTDGRGKAASVVHFPTRSAAVAVAKGIVAPHHFHLVKIEEAE